MPPLGWRAPLRERLMYRVKKNHRSGCWLWVGPVDDRETHLPYGRVWFDGTTISAHRAMWILEFGQISRGRFVLHKCDNASCVNPAHLKLETARDNTQDMMKKGRDAACRESRRGERSNFAKLTKLQVCAIRRDDRSNSAIAADYGISSGAVWLIKARKNWSHV